MRLPTSPIGSLMTEHRTILRMMDVMRGEIAFIGGSGGVRGERIDTICAFLSVYADRNHHGKEEDILFQRLADRDMAPEHADMMQRLIEGHVYGRAQVGRIRDANPSAMEGDSAAIETVSDGLSRLVEFYPQHIEDEDHGFFKPAITYFTPDERTQMQHDFELFERSLLHEVYAEKLASLETAATPTAGSGAVA